MICTRALNNVYIILSLYIYIYIYIYLYVCIKICSIINLILIEILKCFCVKYLTLRGKKLFIRFKTFTRYRASQQFNW